MLLITLATLVVSVNIVDYMRCQDYMIDGIMHTLTLNTKCHSPGNVHILSSLLTETRTIYTPGILTCYAYL